MWTSALYIATRLNRPRDIHLKPFIIEAVLHTITEEHQAQFTEYSNKIGLNKFIKDHTRQPEYLDRSILPPKDLDFVERRFSTTIQQIIRN